MKIADIVCNQSRDWNIRHIEPNIYVIKGNLTAPINAVVRQLTNTVARRIGIDSRSLHTKDMTEIEIVIYS